MLPVLRVRGPLGPEERARMALSDRPGRGQGLHPKRVWDEVECHESGTLGFRSRPLDRDACLAAQRVEVKFPEKSSDQDPSLGPIIPHLNFKRAIRQSSTTGMPE